MKRKYRKPEQIVKLLRQAEVRLAEGGSVEDIRRQLRISDSTFYYRRKQYGKMELDQVKRLKELQKENSRLKKLVADQALDIDIPKEALSGNCCPRQNSLRRALLPLRLRLRSSSTRQVRWMTL